MPLATRPEIVVLNKIDAADEASLRKHRDSFKKKGLQVFEISAATGKNIKALVDELGKRVFSE
jgi:50S ribosomal subunit-associated GTPase HflX